MLRRLGTWSLLVAVMLLLACTSSDAVTPSPAAGGAPESDTSAKGSDGSATPAAEPVSRVYRIVTLGDAYTYGAGTETPGQYSWPAQMAAILNHYGDLRVRVSNLAEKSIYSEDVILFQLPEVGAYGPDVVTLQVGVNDIVGGETHDYAEHVAQILEELLRLLPAERIFVITTPDHTLTEWGKASASRGTAEDVEQLNATLVEVATDRGIGVIDIGPVNERVTVDPSLLVDSYPPGPYPTAKQYAGWAELIGRHIHDALETVRP
jgi:lysophospholipase L1-like esterase